VSGNAAHAHSEGQAVSVLIRRAMVENPIYRYETIIG